jgi:uncharacterized membrane protein YkoI
MRRRDLLALFLALAVYPAQARADDDDDDDDDDDHDDALRGVTDQRVLELEDLLRRFAEQIEGKVVDIQLREEDDRLVFRVTYVAPDGHVRRATLDAATGAVIG